VSARANLWLNFVGGENMAIKPLADRVLIEAAPEKEEKIGSIFIPDTAKEKPNVGVIVAAGPGK